MAWLWATLAMIFLAMLSGEQGIRGAAVRSAFLSAKEKRCMLQITCPPCPAPPFARLSSGLSDEGRIRPGGLGNYLLFAGKRSEARNRYGRFYDQESADDMGCSSN
jgi:hypothetical protein